MKNIKILQCKTLFIGVFIIFQISQIKGQAWDWASSFNAEGYSNGICRDTSGNILICGKFNSPTITFGSYTLSATGSTNTAYIAKYDSNGNTLWAKTSTGGNAQCNAVNTDGENFYITGSYYGPSIIFDSYTLTASGKYNAFLLKYDSNGNLIWAKSSNGQSQGVCSGSSISLDAAGNIYITGSFAASPFTFGTTSLPNAGAFNIFVAKYDNNGQCLWAKGPTGTGYNFGRSVSADVLGNVFVTGVFQQQTITFGSITLTNTDNTGNNDVFLAKYDTNGNILWAQNAIGTGDDRGASVSTDINGNAYLTGYSSSPILAFGSSTINAQFGSTFLTKYDANGNIIWAKSPVLYSNHSSSGSFVYITANSVYVTGFFFPQVTFGSHTLTASNYTTNPDPMFIVQYDLNGNVVNAASLESGGSGQNFICADKFCNAYITGNFQPDSLIIGNDTLKGSTSSNPFLAKLSFACQTQGLNELSNNNYGISIFPNPNNGVFKIKIDSEIKDGELIIINQLGQKVFTQKITEGDNNIISNWLSAGLYHYTILQNKQQVGNGKLIIEKD